MEGLCQQRSSPSIIAFLGRRRPLKGDGSNWELYLYPKDKKDGGEGDRVGPMCEESVERLVEELASTMSPYGYDAFPRFDVVEGDLNDKAFR